MINTLLNNRYQILAEIGRGGMGIVYRGHDTLLERDVAVKVLWTNNIGTQGRTRLLREAQAAARLNHPNIINIYDAGDSEGLSYIVMELLDGDSLFDKKPDTMAGTLEVLLQVCSALDHAHTNGIIHRDLKPENVIVTARGIAKLTDFGLSRSIRARVSLESGIVGTVYYLAPEQALKQDVDARADLYALGVMMYELLTGRLPFTADDPLAVISQHLNAPVVPPSTYQPGIPPVLDALVVRLMSKRPTDRPSSAAEVIRVLNEAVINPDQPAPDLDIDLSCDLSPLTRLARGRMVGRKHEMDEIKSFWRDITHRTPVQETPLRNVLLISGESGVGKTPLVKEIRTLAEVTGAPVFFGECYERSRAPYAPIAQALRDAQPLPDDLSPAVLADVNALIGENLTLPQNERGSAQSVPALSGPVFNTQDEQQRLFGSLYQVFERLSNRNPFILLVEDIHWADPGTLLLLHYLARRSRADGIKMLLVATYRQSELSQSPAMRSFLFDLHQERLSHTIALEPFTREQTRELLQSMFMEEIDDDFLDAIYGVTEGNLFFIEEICKTLIEEGRLTCGDGGWQLTHIEEMELPQSVRMALQMRVSRLPEQAQEVLRLAAVIGREFDFDILRSTSDLDEDTLIDSLEQAERAQLIAEVHGQAGKQTTTTETFAFAHTLIPATLRDNISGLRRRRIHRRLASTIERLRSEDMEALAYHYSQAGEPEQARIYHLRAGDRARKLFANEEAICFYTEALRLTRDGDQQRFNILAAREQVYDLLGERDLQRLDIDSMQELADRLGDDAMRCDALLALAHYYLDTELYKARVPSLQAIEIARRLKDPVREGRGLHHLGYGAWLRGDNHESLSALEQAVSRFQQSGQLNEAAECLHTLSLVTGTQGLGELTISQRYAEDAIRLSRQAGDRRQEAISLRRLAIAYLDQEKFSETLTIAQQALKLHNEMGDRVEECAALNLIGLALAHQRQFDEAFDHMQRSLALALQVHSNHSINLALENIQWLRYRRDGDFEGGLAFADQYLAHPEIAGNPYLMRTVLLSKADILYTIGQYQASLDTLREVEQLDAPHLTPFVEARLYIMQAYSYAGDGDFNLAREALDKVRELARRFERPVDAVNFSSAQIYIAWLEDDRAALADAAAKAEKSVLLLRGTAWHFDLGVAMHIASRMALIQGRTAQALEWSTEALRLTSAVPLVFEDILFTHYNALKASGKENEAAQTLEHAFQRVIQVAGNLKNPSYRQSWLERVRTNREILLEWQKIQNRTT